jgi:hypothetical protein
MHIQSLNRVERDRLQLISGSFSSSTPPLRQGSQAFFGLCKILLVTALDDRDQPQGPGRRMDDDRAVKQVQAAEPMAQVEPDRANQQ